MSLDQYANILSNWRITGQYRLKGDNEPLDCKLNSRIRSVHQANKIVMNTKEEDYYFDPEDCIGVVLCIIFSKIGGITDEVIIQEENKLKIPLMIQNFDIPIGSFISSTRTISLMFCDVNDKNIKRLQKWFWNSSSGKFSFYDEKQYSSKISMVFRHHFNGKVPRLPNEGENSSLSSSSEDSENIPKKIHSNIRVKRTFSLGDSSSEEIILPSRRFPVVPQKAPILRNARDISETSSEEDTSSFEEILSTKKCPSIDELEEITALGTEDKALKQIRKFLTKKNIKSLKNTNILANCAGNGWIDVVKDLIDEGIYVGHSAIEYAITSRNKECVKFLLEHSSITSTGKMIEIAIESGGDGMRELVINFASPKLEEEYSCFL